MSSTLVTLSVADYRETTEAIREAASDAMRAAETFEQHVERLEMIRDTKMYSEDGYKNWSDYCRKGLGITKQHANRQIRSADVLKRIQVEHQGSTPKPSPTVAAALSKAPPEVQAKVWAEAVEEHGDKVTAAKVAEAVAKKTPAPKPPKAERPVRNGKPTISTADRKEASAALGKLIRTLEKMGLYHELQGSLDTIARRLAR